MNGAGDPIDAWRAAKDRHPTPGTLVDVAREQLDELVAFLRRQAIVTLPESEPVVVAPSPEFYRWAFASMWTPGPFETKASRAYYYLTDALPSWTPDRQEEHLRDFNLPTLWNISIHEVYPGHFVHYQYLRTVASKVRKSTFFAPMSFVEGWAHYCEQMMVEAGFRKGDHAFKLGQLAEALVRLARVVVGIRLHCEDLSVEQGMRFFRDEAYLEESTARREAERGTFDPGYVTYSIGKLMMLKLRQDFKEQQDSKVLAARLPRCRAGRWQRAVLGASPASARRHQRFRRGARVGRHGGFRRMPLYEYECDTCGKRFELIQKFSDGPPEACPKCGKGPVQRQVSSPAFHLKGSGWYITDYARKGTSPEGESSKGESSKGRGLERRGQRRGLEGRGLEGRRRQEGRHRRILVQRGRKRLEESRQHASRNALDPHQTAAGLRAPRRHRPQP